MSDNEIELRSRFVHVTEQQKDEIERLTRQIGVQLLGRNREAAVHLVDKGIALLQPTKQAGFLGRPLSDVLDTRTCNALEEKLGCMTIADVLQQTPTMLFTIPNFGLQSVLAVYAAIAKAAVDYADRLAA